MADELTIEIAADFMQFAELALTRLRYLHPGVNWTLDERKNTIVIVCDDSDRQELEKGLHYQLYREKIMQDTLLVRQQLYGAG